MATDAIVVLCTFPSATKAAEIARTLVSEQLVACMNISEVRSIYAWKGAIEDEPEALGVIKTTADRFAALKTRIVELHPYEVPEVIALPITSGHAPYLAWLAASTR
ncbi:MAG: divalent-cation tolerance protein CutA [Myxococcota bacterium]|nr:divalent-cation tolerance protein CutA [Deltaproteobacteria bacterium]MDQ3334598.1 divalent-cation tolerance protein CutA [Myxococcota bacterium]